MRVLLSGYYGFGNHGDEAILAGLVAGLRARGHEPVVLSADPDGTRALHGVEARPRVPGVPTALRSVDAVVSGGGGLLQDATSSRSLAYYLGILRLGRMFGLPTVVYGQSVGPLSDRGRSWLRYALRGIPVAVRDAPSERLLAELGISCARTADAALLAPPDPVHPAPGAEAVVPADARRAEPMHAEAMHASTDPGDRPVVLVPRAGYPAHTAALGEIAARLSAGGVPVDVVALHPAQDAAEVRALQDVAAGAAPHLPAVWHEARRRMTRARAVASTRLHALVFAAGAGVPHAGLVYDPKVSGFLADSGGRAFLDPIDVDALHRSLVAPAPVDPEMRTRLRARAEAGLDWLDATLRRGT